MIEKIRQYFSSVIIEMKKVTWLTKDELISSTMVVGVFSVIIAIFLFFVDFGITEFISRLLGCN